MQIGVPDTHGVGFAAECRRQSSLVAQAALHEPDTLLWLEQVADTDGSRSASAAPVGMNRGDLVTVALQGDLGKPRPALVLQSTLFSMHPSVCVLLVTSTLQDAPLFRVGIEPDTRNGLRRASQVMVDKMQAVTRTRVGPVIGQVDHTTMLVVNRALAVFLGLASGEKSAPCQSRKCGLRKGGPP